MLQEDFKKVGYALNIPNLIREYEQDTILRFFGHGVTPVQKGAFDGATFDLSVREKTRLSIQGAFEDSRSRLHQYLSNYLTFLKEEKTRLHTELQEEELHLYKEESIAGGRYFERKQNCEAAERIRQIELEADKEQKEIQDELLACVRIMEQMNEEELKSIDLSLEPSIENYQKLTKLILQYGKAKTGAGDKGIYGRLEESLREQMNAKINNLELRFSKRSNMIHKSTAKRIERIQENRNQTPTWNRVVFTTIIAVLIFLVEIPLHYEFTFRELRIYDIPRWFISFGLPLILGLAFKQVLRKKSYKLSKTTNYVVFFLTIILILGIGWINSMSSITSETREKYSALLPFGQMLIFVTLTSVLSIVGSIYFAVASYQWKQRRVVNFPKFKGKVNYRAIQEATINISMLHKQISSVEFEIRQVSSQINNLKTEIDERFVNLSNITTEQYQTGFTAGWANAVLERFNERKPIPAKLQFVSQN